MKEHDEQVDNARGDKEVYRMHSPSVRERPDLVVRERSDISPGIPMRRSTDDISPNGLIGGESESTRSVGGAVQSTNRQPTQKYGREEAILLGE